MEATEITVHFPQPDYAVVFVGNRAAKSFSAPAGDDRTAARALLKIEAFAFADGVAEGFSEARSVLGNNLLRVVTRR